MRALLLSKSEHTFVSHFLPNDAVNVRLAFGIWNSSGPCIWCTPADRHVMCRIAASLAVSIKCPGMTMHACAWSLGPALPSQADRKHALVTQQCAACTAGHHEVWSRFQRTSKVLKLLKNDRMLGFTSQYQLQKHVLLLVCRGRVLREVRRAFRRVLCHLWTMPTQLVTSSCSSGRGRADAVM